MTTQTASTSVADQLNSALDDWEEIFNETLAISSHADRGHATVAAHIDGNHWYYRFSYNDDRGPGLKSLRVCGDYWSTAREDWISVYDSGPIDLSQVKEELLNAMNVTYSVLRYGAVQQQLAVRCGR